MRREKIEHLVTIGMIEVKRTKGKKRENMLNGIPKWLKVGRWIDALRATWDRNVWKVMIAYSKE